MESITSNTIEGVKSTREPSAADYEELEEFLDSQNSQESQPEQNDHKKSVQRLLNVLERSGDLEKMNTTDQQNRNLKPGEYPLKTVASPPTPLTQCPTIVFQSLPFSKNVVKNNWTLTTPPK